MRGQSLGSERNLTGMSSIIPADTRSCAPDHGSTIPAGEGKTFRHGSTVIAVFRTRDERLLAPHAHCLHGMGPLADGFVGAGKLVCPLHAYKFDLATGQPVGNNCQALRTYPVRVTDAGEIVLQLDPEDGNAGS